jgi:uncharacterized membrane protein YczE
MKNEILKYLKLFLGFFCCSLGVIIIIKSNLGFSPWDVLHQGISNIFKITIGQASILIGLIVITLDLFLGEQVGSGTIFNIFSTGIFMDLILYLDIIPLSTSLFTGVSMMFLGLFILSVGCYLYISTGLGCGPRDALMVALTKKTNFSVSAVRNTIEIGVLATGYLMGGYAGAGTVVVALFTGIFMQRVFKLFNFDVKTVVHRDIINEIILLKTYAFGRWENAHKLR